MPRFLALGDSYTIGEGVAEPACWPRQLAASLRGDGVPLEDPLIVARTGWTVDELDAGITAAAPTGPFALVSLLVGVNDQFRGLPLVGFLRGYAEVLARAVTLAGDDPSRVVVLSIPDWGVTPFAADDRRAGIAAAIDAFNAAARGIVEPVGARWVDVTGDSRERTDGWLTTDGLHPSGRQYAAWTARALPAARAALGY